MRVFLLSNRRQNCLHQQRYGFDDEGDGVFEWVGHAVIEGMRFLRDEDNVTTLTLRFGSRVEVYNLHEHTVYLFD